MKLVKESYEVSEELAKRLNSILADEFLASEAYRLAIVAMKGNKQHRLEEIAEKNGEDELEDHFKNLSDWMQSKGIKVVTDTDEMKEITNGTILKFTDGMSTKEIVDQLILSEEEAIAVYEDTIPHTELDLNTMLCGFLKDEREHLKELTDCLNEMGGGDKAESEVDEYHKSRQFNEKSVPYMILAELVKITAAGEKTIKVDEVPSYKTAFEMLQDYILEDPDMDDYVVEKYEDYMTGRDVHGKEKEIRLLEKNGEIGERCVSGFYEIVLRVAEQANPNERLGDYFLDDDYYAESRKRRLATSGVGKMIHKDKPFKVRNIDWDANLPTGPRTVDFGAPLECGEWLLGNRDEKWHISRWLEEKYDAKVLDFDFKRARNFDEDCPEYVVSNIEWDVNLPKSVVVNVPYDVVKAGYDEVEEYISDYLSDKYGFCHYGFECPQLDKLMELQ